MKTFESLVSSNIAKVRSELDNLDIETMAKETGIIQRRERKLSSKHFLLSLLALSAGYAPTLEKISVVIQLIIGDSYSKQAVSKRVGQGIDQFLGRVVASVFAAMTSPSDKRGLFAAFNRVLLQDSTTLKLPDRFSEVFPGSANQAKRTQSSMKIQLISDLRCGRILQLSLSGFTRNDQAASGDVLSVASAGDLVLRDLGYFVPNTFKLMIDRGIFFLSRYHRGTSLIDPETGETIDLCKRLRLFGKLDIDVELGQKYRIPVRLVCSRVPDSVANERRRKAKATAKKDHRYTPTKEALFLMGWSIFITNVGTDVWSGEDFQPVYRLRWRIETIFKAWKSHLKITELNFASESMLRLSVMTKLLFCAMTHHVCAIIERFSPDTMQVSLLRIARILNDCATLIAAMVLNITPAEYLSHIFRFSSFYEHRPDRKNFVQLLTETGLSLG